MGGPSRSAVGQAFSPPKVSTTPGRPEGLCRADKLQLRWSSEV